MYFELKHQVGVSGQTRAQIYIYIYIYVQDVLGGMRQTSGECSLS